jgi:hypothetical protein
MPPLPRTTGRELVRALGKLGWVIVTRSILSQASVTVEDLRTVW